MNAIRRLGNSSLATTALMGCFSIILLVSLCGILAIARRPTVLVPVATRTPSNPIPTKTLPLTATVTRIYPTATTWILPTNTLPPTRPVTYTPTPPEIEVTPLTTEIERAGTPVTSCGHSHSPQVGKVIDVIDGDTIKVLLDGLVVRVKYIGVDAPESVTRLEYLGKEAKQRNRELVSGREVLLYRDVSDRDRFDSLLRYVFVNDRFINYELVNLGYASALDEPPDSACALMFSQAATSAKDRSLGIWAPHTAQPVLSVASGSMIIYNVNKEGEFADLQNVGETAIDLTGWRLVSETGNQECKLNGIIHPYEILRVFSGIDQPGFNCGFDKPIWLNTEPDPAVLYDPEGLEVYRYP